MKCREYEALFLCMISHSWTEFTVNGTEDRTHVHLVKQCHPITPKGYKRSCANNVIKKKKKKKNEPHLQTMGKMGKGISLLT